MLRFRRQSQVELPWVGVAQEGAVVLAAQIAHGEERPSLNWLWRSDASDLASGLKALQRSRRALEMQLVGALPADAYRIVAAQAPEVPRTDWADAMRWSLREQVDFAVDDAIIDVLEVPGATQLRQSNPILTVVVPREAHTRVELAADDVGLRWKALEVAETALRNLSALAEEPGKAHALLAFGDNQGLLVITFQGELVMMRHIEVHVSAMTGSDESRHAALNRAALEVLRTIDTFERMHSQVTLQGLSVAPPPGTSAEQIIAMLAEMVYVPVQAYDLSQYIDLSALGDEATRLSRQSSLQELCAIGSALRPQVQKRGGQQLKLIDDSEAANKAPVWGATFGLRIVGAAAGVGLLAGLALMLVAARAQQSAARVEAELQDLQKAVAQPEPDTLTREVESLRRREFMQRQLRDVLNGTASSASLGYSDFLMALGRQSQGGVWITGLKVKGDGADVELKGRMTNPAALPLYLRKLEQEDRFKGRRFAQLELRDVVEGDKTPIGVTEFTLKGRETAPPASKRDDKKP